MLFLVAAAWAQDAQGKGWSGGLPTLPPRNLGVGEGLGASVLGVGDARVLGEEDHGLLSHPGQGWRSGCLQHQVWG